MLLKDSERGEYMLNCVNGVVSMMLKDAEGC
jgi:hypothetical protein